MKKIIFAILSLTVAIISDLNAQTAGIEKGLNAISTDAIKAQLEFLSSDWTEGRKTGEKGEYLAADYIASMLQIYGIKPGGDYPAERGLSNLAGNREKTYFQNYILIKTSAGDEQVLKLRTKDANTIKTYSYTYNIDFTVRPVDRSIEIEAPVVFSGYGFRSEKLKHDDLSKLDLDGKFILKISGTPGFAKKTLSQSELSSASREFEIIAREKGALGIIEFSPEQTIVRNRFSNQNSDISPSENNQSAGIPWADYSLPGKKNQESFFKIVISVGTANDILSGTGFVLDDFIRESETNSNTVIPVIKSKSIYLKTSVRTETVKVRNVIGILEGTNPDQIIVLGAHYDHLGMANGYTWNGADDNGSGTVGVMTIAKAFMESGIKPAKTLIFALWSAEEEGLLGSRYYVDNLQYPRKNLRLNVNFDMISRYISENEPKKVSMIYTESCPVFRTITEENIKKYNIDLDVDFQPSKDPPGGSDHRSFVAAGIPVMRFKPGHREQYHTPDDETGTVNWDIMEKIVKISFANICDLANSDW
jgi:hypothetical protein